MKYITDMAFKDHNDALKKGYKKSDWEYKVTAFTDNYDKDLDLNNFLFRTQHDIQRTNVKHNGLLFISILNALANVYPYTKMVYEIKEVRSMPGVIAIYAKHCMSGRIVMVVHVIKSDDKHVYVNTTDKVDIKDGFTCHNIFLEFAEPDFDINPSNFSRFLLEELNNRHIAGIADYLANQPLVQLLRNSL